MTSVTLQPKMKAEQSLLDQAMIEISTQVDTMFLNSTKSFNPLDVTFGKELVSSSASSTSPKNSN